MNRKEADRRIAVHALQWRLGEAYLDGKLSAVGLSSESLSEDSPAVAEAAGLYRKEAEMLLISLAELLSD